MRAVEFIYVEVINETEQVLVFEATFNGKSYAVPIVLNMALPIESQDVILVNAIVALGNMTRKDAAESVNCCDDGACKCESCRCKE